MENKFATYTGVIQFEPPNYTKKHNNQASWKRIAMVLMPGDITEFYAWFVKKRYNLELNKPLRGAHISFINDSLKDLSNNGQKSIEEINATWEVVKKKWDGQKVEIYLDVDARTDSKTWWLSVPKEKRDLLQGIRNELGLGIPYFNLHMSLGYANEKNIAHSEYIHNLIKSGLIY